MGRDTIQLEDAVSTISQEYLLEFTSEYGIPESLHPELPGPEEPIVEFPEGKVGVYTKFFEFANFRIPISQFLFDILGHYQIHLSQLSVIGAAKDRLSREILLLENLTTTEVVLEPNLEKEVAAIGPLVNKRRRKRGNDEADANALPKVLRKGNMLLPPCTDTHRRKSSLQWE
ncbi:hypothetical protein Tco_0724505 [Tanacetum coccineum]